MNHPIKKYFQIEELVDEPTLKKYGEELCWSFFDPRLIDTLFYIREKLGKPIIINNWHRGGNLTQRGLRTNKSPMVVAKNDIYCSAHMRGQAVDFDVVHKSAQDVRFMLNSHSIGERLPHNIRLESSVHWVHLDVATFGQVEKVKIF